MSRPYQIILLNILIVLLPSNPAFAQSFVRCEGQQFIKDGEPYHYLGVNYWYGMNLASAGPRGDRERLLRELDQLQQMGISNLRIMAASEGPDTEPWRMVPSLQTAPGVYHQQLLEGLDFLLIELGKRRMHAVLCLNNIWPWSGGFGQYLNWTTGKAIPYPPPAEGGNWLRYIRFVSAFFENEKAQALYQQHIAQIVNRVNSISGLPYKEDPTIFSWQLANEPRAMLGLRKYTRWISQTAAYIRSLDPQHLISVGSEGNALLPWSRKFRHEHRLKDIDYCTAHIWVENWNWYNPKGGERSFAKALKKAKRYLRKHQRISQQLNKPFVLEEFGLARDGGSHAVASPTSFRDRYYAALFDDLIAFAKSHNASAATNIWSWAGEGRPRQPRAIWQPGDDFTGDPPFEHQGWYSVYDEDESTIRLLRTYAQEMKTL